MNIILPIKDIFIIAGNIVFSVLYNEHLEFPCRCQLLSSNSEVMQELYIEKELFIKRTTENDCRALVLRGTLEYLFDEIIAGECALALLQKEIKKDLSIDTPLIAYDKYMSYIVYQSYNVKYDDKNTEKIINNVIDEALKERETSRGGTN